mmetsp:Transcript_6657/g.15429  ORF Transcript_6657/g.15429 Transcript_6657/m.15429 type:complete len:158 (-) Transcript_6657:11-484(-)
MRSASSASIALQKPVYNNLCVITCVQEPVRGAGRNIAQWCGIADKQTLVDLNLDKYPALTAASKLRKGTTLLLPGDVTAETMTNKKVARCLLSEAQVWEQQEKLPANHPCKLPAKSPAKKAKEDAPARSEKRKSEELLKSQERRSKNARHSNPSPRR